MKIPKEHFDVRSDTISGIIQTAEIDLHFSEWWSGDGIDFSFSKGDPGSLTHHTATVNISLSMAEIMGLVTAAVYCGMVDMEEVEDNVDKLKKAISKREETIKRLKKEFNYD